MSPSRLDYKAVQWNGMGQAWDHWQCRCVLLMESCYELRTIPSWSERGTAMDLHWQQWDGESETLWALPADRICHHWPREKWWVLPRFWCRGILWHSHCKTKVPKSRLVIRLILINWQEAAFFRRQHIPIHLCLHWRWFCHSLSGWMRHQGQIPPFWLFSEKESSFEKMVVPMFAVSVVLQPHIHLDRWW